MKRILAIVVTALLSLGLMSGAASAQDYVPDTPPTISVANTQVTFTDLEPDRLYEIGFFDAAGVLINVTSGFASADGDFSAFVPEGAVAVEVFTRPNFLFGPYQLDEVDGYTSTAAPQPPAPAPRVPATVIQAPAATNVVTGNIALARTSSLAQPRPNVRASAGVPPLALTGSNTSEPIILGVALIAVGSVVTLASRRREA